MLLLPFSSFFPYFSSILSKKLVCKYTTTTNTRHRRAMALVVVAKEALLYTGSNLCRIFLSVIQMFSLIPLLLYLLAVINLTHLDKSVVKAEMASTTNTSVTYGRGDSRMFRLQSRLMSINQYHHANNNNSKSSLTSSMTTSHKALWSDICPCRLCQLDQFGNKKILCDNGGWQFIPINLISNEIEVIEIDAPQANPNNLTLGPLFYRFPELIKLRVVCSNVPAIGHSTFRYRTKLLELDLSHNRINLLINSDFKGLAKLELLNLSHNNLKDLPSGTFQHLGNLRQLSLAHNRLETITTRLFYNLTNIEVLDLSNNPIAEINPQNVIDLRPVRQLMLSNCRLKQLHSLFYRNLPNLQLLDLRNNQINQISKYEFRNLYKLSELYLDGNQLSSIPAAAFFSNTLEKLGLSQNRLNELHQETFLNCTVVELDIADNNFTTFDRKTFQPLAASLRVLDLRNIQSLKEPSASISHVLAPLSRLEKVQLANLSLESSALSPELFATHRHSLRSVNLSHNSLVNLSARLIDELTNLEEFDLSYNSLYELNSDFLYLLTLFRNLTSVYLDHNPWSCYRCHLLYLRNWISATPNGYLNVCQYQNRCAVCQFPPNLDGYMVHQMEEWQLEWCTDPTVQLRVSTTEPNVGLVLALLIIIILIIVIVGVIIYYRNRGAIYFTNEDLLYARSSTVEDRQSSVYNISSAIRNFADATASPPESVRSSSIDSVSRKQSAAASHANSNHDRHSQHTKSNHRHSNNNNNTNHHHHQKAKQNSLANSSQQNSSIDSKSKLFSVSHNNNNNATINSSKSTRGSNHRNQRQRSNGSTSSGNKTSDRHRMTSFEDELDDDDEDTRHSKLALNSHSSAAARYRILKQHSSSNQSDTLPPAAPATSSRPEIPPKPKKFLITQPSTNRSKSSTSITTASSASSSSASSEPLSKSESGSVASNLSHPTSLPSALQPYDEAARSSVEVTGSFDSPSPNNAAGDQQHGLGRLHSRSSLDSLTAALAEGDAVSTSPSSTRSSDFGAKSLVND